MFLLYVWHLIPFYWLHTHVKVITLLITTVFNHYQFPRAQTPLIFKSVFRQQWWILLVHMAELQFPAFKVNDSFNYLLLSHPPFFSLSSLEHVSCLLTAAITQSLKDNLSLLRKCPLWGDCTVTSCSSESLCWQFLYCVYPLLSQLTFSSFLQ